jgi:hypothetical protein
MKPMITNGGPHPADKWADMTTDTILDLIAVKEDSVTEEAAAARQAKRDLRPILFDIFMGHHEGIQSDERFKLDTITMHADACEHVAKPLELHDDCRAALEEVNAALNATPFAAHFAKPDVQAILLGIIGQHTADVQHIERRWHVDRLAAKGV